MYIGGFKKGVNHDACGDCGVNTDVGEVAGVVIVPGDDFGAGAIG